MSKIDENEILRRLKLLSQIEPASDATDRAIEKVRDSLSDKEKESASTSLWRFPKGPIAKLAAAAVLMIAAGYAVGRLTTPGPDMEQLQSSLEKSLRASLTKEMDQRWQRAFTANCIKFKDELQQQVRSDLTEFAAQTLAASNTLTEQRLIQLVELIEAARERDRQQVAAALKTIEFSRLQDKNQLGKGLVALAAQTSELRDKNPD
jgi:parvulin-like peptidyl-prolyl isomerase